MVWDKHGLNSLTVNSTGSTRDEMKEEMVFAFISKKVTFSFATITLTKKKK